MRTVIAGGHGKIAQRLERLLAARGDRPAGLIRKPEQAEALLADGRARLEHEVAELRARAEADIAAAGSRVNDELQAEISRLAAAAVDRVLADGAIDSATQQWVLDAARQQRDCPREWFG